MTRSIVEFRTEAIDLGEIARLVASDAPGRVWVTFKGGWTSEIFLPFDYVMAAWRNWTAACEAHMFSDDENKTPSVEDVLALFDRLNPYEKSVALQELRGGK